MNNQAMKRKIDTGEAIDISDRPRNGSGDYMLDTFVDGADYCDRKREAWIWSIGKHKVSGQILASTTSRFYLHPEYECLFLR